MSLIFFTTPSPVSPKTVHGKTPAPLFQEAERLPWQLLCHQHSVLKLVVVAEPEDNALVNVQGWGALRILPVSGRRRDEAACKSWAACPGRSASKKVEVEEEEGKSGWEQRRGAGIPRIFSSLSKNCRPPLPPSPPQLPRHLLWHPQLFIMRSSGENYAHCMLWITSSRTGRPSVGTPCRRYTKGEEAATAKYISPSQVCMKCCVRMSVISTVNLLQAIFEHYGDASQKEYAGKWELWRKRHHGGAADPRIWGGLVG